MTVGTRKAKASYRLNSDDQPPPCSAFNITIFKDNDHYKFIINSSYEQDVYLTQNDVTELNNLTSLTLSEIICLRNGIADDHTVLQRQSDILLDKGRQIALAIFGVEGCNTLNNELNRMNSKRIQIYSNDFIIPWEILCTAPDENCNINDIWGLKYIVFKYLKTSSPKQRYFKYIGLPSFSLFSCKSLNSFESVELPYFASLDSKFILLNEFEPVYENTHRHSMNRLCDYLRRNFNILHFSCHAYEEDNHILKYLLLKDDFKLTTLDLAAMEESCLKSEPLVVLNACTTGVSRPASIFNFPMSFYKLGARVVVATECLVEDALAAEFSKKFYQYFVQEKRNLGESVLAVRHDLMKLNDLSGLIYSIYGIDYCVLQEETSGGSCGRN
jgi:hypothetical protein